MRGEAYFEDAKNISAGEIIGTQGQQHLRENACAPVRFL